MSADHPSASRLPNGLALGAAYAASAALVHHYLTPLPSSLVLPSLGLGIALVLLSVIDLDHYRLPDALTLPLIAGGLLVAAAVSTDTVVWHVAGAVAGYAAFVAIAHLYEAARGQAGLGHGDAKLFAAAGAWVGLADLHGVLLVATASALATVLATAAVGRAIGLRERIAFGPHLAAGLWLVWLLQPSS